MATVRPNKICKVPGCTNLGEAWKRGQDSGRCDYCYKHLPNRRKNARRPCSVWGCDKKRKYNAPYCGMHAKRKHRHGCLDPYGTDKVRPFTAGRVIYKGKIEGGDDE